MPVLEIALVALGELSDDAATPSTANASTVALFASAVAWAALWVNLIVIPFFGKSERLHLDYHSSGKLNAALSAIEANRLIPALAQMFNRALDAKADRRTRVDIEALLQEVQFLPDLEAAQSAMAAMESLRSTYRTLCRRAGWLWMWGLAHSLSTLASTAIYVILIPQFDWSKSLLWAAIGCWSVTLLSAIWHMRRFFSQMSSFNRDLELHGGE